MSYPNLLSNIRVVEQGGFITGPHATMLLADLGADVIKVERPDGGDPFRSFEGGLYAPHFQSCNRNKRSITLDTREPEDRDVFDQLIGHADVYVQNFRPGIAERLGVGPERLMGLNPKLIYCSITGFGATGPYAEQACYDTVAQAYSGFLSMQLDPDRPRIAGPALADAVTGLTASHAILAALHERQTSGRGRLVEVSMLEAMTYLCCEPFAQHFAGRTPGAYGRARLSQSYVVRCADERLLALHLSSPEKFWTNLLETIERPQLADDSRFASRRLRIENHSQLSDELDRVFRTRTRAEWLKRLVESDVPCAPVYDLGETLADPQSQHLQLEVQGRHPEHGEVRTIRAAAQFDGQRSLSFRAAPVLGEHNDEIRAALR
ncbi:Crotonobetainyl-CoA:carnitine CoA-transferase CaiB [Paraburkholderia unamae]|uniref:CaiB/BaiF CoA transferase family protein n=1 Tax=Paraburkholderia unamae TaxID=219649 RepID=UPI001CB53500|nr:CoA transferase [Paraburkholderia unamae]CAG9246031.1 Crotonobetainyl-CoA:carnitine CoA-transferase CaiB [Paraburkholderia unamae]